MPRGRTFMRRSCRRSLRLAFERRMARVLLSLGPVAYKYSFEDYARQIAGEELEWC